MFLNSAQGVYVEQNHSHYDYQIQGSFTKNRPHLDGNSLKCSTSSHQHTIYPHQMFLNSALYVPSTSQ